MAASKKTSSSDQSGRHPIIAREQKVCAPCYLPLPIVLSHGRGSWLWDEMGARYLDMMSAYSAVSHGHCHPRMVRAFFYQSGKLCIASRAFYHDKLAPFLEKLCTLTNQEMAVPMNTGAEAVETGIKAARRWGYRVKGIPENKAEIIVADNNFHGRTTTIVSFSSSEDSYKDFGPPTPGFKSVPFGKLEALEKAITPNTAAVLLEPIQGEGGMIFPPDGYLSQVSSLCQKNNVLFLLDEIQSGLGRTGKFLACMHEKVHPDGIMLGKALGGGVFPVSAFLSSREVLELLQPGSHGSTWGGNPLAAVVGLEALNILEDEDLVSRSQELGLYMLKRLQEMTHPAIKDIRGKGLWVGLELRADKITARDFCLKLMDKGILAKDTHETVVRLAPPLVIAEGEIDWAVKKTKEALEEI